MKVLSEVTLGKYFMIPDESEVTKKLGKKYTRLLIRTTFNKQKCYQKIYIKMQSIVQ